MKRISMILLAAGESRRMGSSKQLLILNGETLLRRAINEATKVKNAPLTVVLGARFEQHLSVVSDFPNIQVVTNPNWAEGIGSSIKAGLSSVAGESPDGVLFFVCDQPFLTAEHLINLITVFNEHSGIVASSYGGVRGVPAVFPRNHYSVLLNLDNHEGARRVIEAGIDEVISIDFPGGEIDLDTPDDVLRFKRPEGH